MEKSVLLRRVGSVRSKSIVLFALSAGLIAWAAAEMVPHSLLAAGLAAAAAAAFAAAAAVRECERKAEVRELEKSLDEARDRLKAAVAEKEEIEKENSDKLRQFHSKVSHSLRMPISVIQGYADILRDGLVEDEEIFREYLSRISERTEYINDVLGQIFLEAQTDVRLQTVPLEPVDICRVVERVADDIATAALKLNIGIKVVLAEESITIKGDINLLTKIFYNILGNSLKYMNRDGMINITVSREGGEALIIFKDDGMGLSEEETGHIFELNYQGSNRTTGDGFGLYFVKNGVAVHGGRVFAKSIPGEGMSIFMSFPVVEP